MDMVAEVLLRFPKLDRTDRPPVFSLSEPTDSDGDAEASDSARCCRCVAAAKLWSTKLSLLFMRAIVRTSQCYRAVQ